jgi:methylaspartate mutase sigma subunit
VVIGGKLGTSGSGAHERRDRLRSAGFDMVFEDGAGTVSFPSFLRRLEAGVAG